MQVFLILSGWSTPAYTYLYEQTVAGLSGGGGAWGGMDPPCYTLYLCLSHANINIMTLCLFAPMIISN